MRLAIYRLADRLHQTPKTIREDLTLEDLHHFLALDAIDARNKP